MTSSLAAAALLVGPGSTWGVDLPGTGSTSAVTSEVTATTQTVATQVEQTVQTTTTAVQETVQQAETVAQAPAAAEPVTTQVQDSVQTVASAPAEAVERTAASVGSSAPRQRSGRTDRSVRTLAGARDTVRKLGASAPAGARETAAGAREAAAAVGSATAGLRASRRTRAAREDGLLAAHCAQLSFPLVLPGVDLGALLGTLCAAADDLLASGDSGASVRTSDPVSSLAQALGVVIASAGAPDARAALLERLARGMGDRQVLSPAAGAAVAGAAGRGAAGASGSAAGTSLGQGASVGSAGSDGSRSGATAAERRERLAAGQPGPATKALTAILLANLLLLAALLVGRWVRRRLGPRLVAIGLR